jgi:hypothetical protein
VKVARNKLPGWAHYPVATIATMVNGTCHPVSHKVMISHAGLQANRELPHLSTIEGCLEKAMLDAGNGLSI